ncbi:MAG TPA: glycosyltransferase [Gaiellaceae bacterium]|nr:glycosyltransferase [Gaiellaceae bacterium]
MPLRIATLDTTERQDILTPQQWRERLAHLRRTASAAAASGNVGEIRTALASITSWTDPHRAFQGRCALAEAALSTPATGTAWLQVFPIVAEALLDALEANPCEPVLLNTVGVLLHELGQSAAALTLFKAVVRLDPKQPHAASNLRQAQAASGKPGPKLPPLVVARTRPLAIRAQRIATAARPPEDLTVSLCMIVKDEEEMLPGCLEAVASSVDELIIVDTGSTDRTVEIAESFGAKVIDFPWNGSFSDARNVGLNAATGDWLLYLDADEHMVPEDAPRLRELLGRTWREGFHLVETNYTGGDDSGNAVTHLALRLFRNRPEYRFEGRIHEQKTHHMPTYLPERFEATTIRIRHYGYLKSRVSAKEKSRRNIELLEIEARETPSAFNSFNLGSEYLMLGDPKTAAKHFDESWNELRAGGDWTAAGYAPILASRIALARREAGRIDEARDALAIGIESMPDHTDLHFELALCARAEGDLETAERLALTCLELGDAPARYAAVVGSGTYLALALLGEIAERQGRRDEAEAYYLRSLGEYPDYVPPVLQVVGLLIARGADLEQLRAELPLDRPSAALLAATACLEAGHLDAAEELFLEVLDRQPANDAARIGLAEGRLARCAWAEAVEAASAIEADSPLAAAAAGEILFAHAAAGDEPALRAALAKSESAGLALGDRVLYGAWGDALAGRPWASSLPAAAARPAATALEALLRVKQFHSFELLARVAESIAVPRDEWREVLARLYLRRGFLGSAADEWIASVNEQPTARAFIGLAQVAFARSLPDDAAAFAEHALALDPDADDAQRLLAALRTRAAA